MDSACLRAWLGRPDSEFVDCPRPAFWARLTPPRNHEHHIPTQECRSVGDGARALRYLGLAPEAQLTEIDFANAIHACAAAAAVAVGGGGGAGGNGNGGGSGNGNGNGGGGSGGMVEEAVAAFRRLQGLKTARAGCVCVFLVLCVCPPSQHPSPALHGIHAVP